MAQYEHLPIYREAYKFLIFCENAVRNFSRYNKYTHGTDLRNASREVVKLIVKANNSREKTEVLEDLRLAIEETRLLVRICKEVRAFNHQDNDIKTRALPVRRGKWAIRYSLSKIFTGRGKAAGKTSAAASAPSHSN